MARWRALFLATIVAFGLLAASAPAGSAGAHRALVIVDTGATTYQRVITFDGDSITGAQALQLAGADPVLYTFAGQGGAVCRLFGVGRDAGPGCLGGADGDNRYWAYFRAPVGTSSFTYSRIGAGATTVRDGDVEGWKFATGQPPAWAALAPVAPQPTAAPAPSVSNPNRGGGAIAPGVPGTGSAASASGAAPSAEDLLKIAAALEAASTTTTTAAPGSTGDRPEVQAARAVRRSPRPAASAADAGGGSGGGFASLVGFGAVLVALAAGAVLLRRSRRRPIP